MHIYMYTHTHIYTHTYTHTHTHTYIHTHTQYVTALMHTNIQQLSREYMYQHYYWCVQVKGLARLLCGDHQYSSLQSVPTISPAGNLSTSYNECYYTLLNSVSSIANSKCCRTWMGHLQLAHLSDLTHRLVL